MLQDMFAKAYYTNVNIVFPPEILCDVSLSHLKASVPSQVLQSEQQFEHFSLCWLMGITDLGFVSGKPFNRYSNPFLWAKGEEYCSVGKRVHNIPPWVMCTRDRGTAILQWTIIVIPDSCMRLANNH